MCICTERSTFYSATFFLWSVLPKSLVTTEHLKLYYFTQYVTRRMGVKMHQCPYQICIYHLTLRHYYADLSEGIGFLKYLSGAFCRVCIYGSVNSLNYLHAKYGLCVFGLSIFLIMVVRISVLYLDIIIKSEVWLIWHCLGLGREMVYAVCLSIFLSYDYENLHCATHIEIRLSFWNHRNHKQKTRRCWIGLQPSGANRNKFP